MSLSTTQDRPFIYESESHIKASSWLQVTILPAKRVLYPQLATSDYNLGSGIELAGGGGWGCKELRSFRTRGGLISYPTISSKQPDSRTDTYVPNDRHFLPLHHQKTSNSTIPTNTLLVVYMQREEADRWARKRYFG